MGWCAMQSERVSEISLICPSERMAKRAQRIILELDETIDTFCASLDNVGGLAIELMERGARIIISRGGTAKYLQEQVKATIVSIPYSFSDYVEIMKAAKASGGPVAFFSYDPPSEEVISMCQMLEIPSKYYLFGLKDKEPCVAQAVADGAKIGVGGSFIEDIARKRGLAYLTLESSEESIRHAIETAIQILKVCRQEEQKSHSLKLQMGRYQAILDYTHDAVLLTNANGTIDSVNRIAQQLLRQSEQQLIGAPLDRFLPQVSIHRVLKENAQQLRLIAKMQDITISINCVPITVEDSAQGVLVTFRDVEAIRSEEQKIRIDLHKKGLVATYHFHNIIGSSKEMHRTIQTARSYAGTNATVVIYGETGTGKELFAQSIHNTSARAAAPFVAINCATLDKSLLESELFGYTEGAFTGASKGGKEGLFQIAHRGTIFLDEVAELPIELQARLLRVLQEKEIRKVGGITVIPVNVRVIVATNHYLPSLVAQKLFREDLYYRLSVLTLQIPPLRDRGNDMQEIALHLYQEYCDGKGSNQEERFVSILQQVGLYTWPGNVRELQNFVERISIILINFPDDSQAKQLVGTMISELVAVQNSGPQKNDLSQQERNQILRALERNEYQLGTTAVELGVSRTTLWRKMNKYHLYKR